MGEVLSQEEINKLLGAIESGGSDIPDDKNQLKIKIYNFDKPEVFSESRHNTLSLLHE